MPQQDEFTKYVLLAKIKSATPQNPQELASLWGEIRTECETVGADVEASYAALGEYDFIALVDAPDYDTCFKASLIMERRGLDVQTMRVAPTETFGELVVDL